MIASDHDCHWTRRRETELIRAGGTLTGAGISPRVLDACARRLGHPLIIAPDPESDDAADEIITIGPWSGGLHDGCFVFLDADDSTVRAALIAAVVELHAHYLGVTADDAWAMHVASRLEPGTVVRVRSLPRRRSLTIRHYSRDATWLARAFAPVARLPVAPRRTS